VQSGLPQEAQSAQGGVDEDVPEDAREGDGRRFDVRIREAPEPSAQVQPRDDGTDDTGHAARERDPDGAGAAVLPGAREGRRRGEEEVRARRDRKIHRPVGPGRGGTGTGHAQRRRRGPGAYRVAEEEQRRQSHDGGCRYERQ